MITYAQLSTKPAALKSLTGMTQSEFADLLQNLKPLYEAAEAQRLNRPDRQRAPGGGSKHKLDLSDRLLMTLVRLHLHLTTEALGRLFEVDKSTVSRNIRRLLPLLRQLGIETDTPEWRYKRGRPLKEVIREHPDLAAVIDIAALQKDSSQSPTSGSTAGDDQGHFLHSLANPGRLPKKLTTVSLLHQLWTGLQRWSSSSSSKLSLAFALAVVALILLGLNAGQKLLNIPYAI